MNKTGFTGCGGETIPVFTEGTVKECSVVQGAVPAGSVYSLTVELNGAEKSLPAAGQFFMLRSKKSQVLLARPISVFNVIKENDKDAKIQFLILLKGQGTKELCSLKAGDLIEMIGPCGNAFPKPQGGIVAICGAGVGVAPVAGFASTLPEHSYDFYASFKSGSYGLENIQSRETFITTEDASAGICGMITAALDAKILKEKNYEAVYACGPAPMLKYIQQICKETGVKCYLSMESRMACGMGVCLGCTIQTVHGYRRCCKDGPVFLGDELIFEAQKTGTSPKENIATGNSDFIATQTAIKSSKNIASDSGEFAIKNEICDKNSNTDGKNIANEAEFAIKNGICDKNLTQNSNSIATGNSKSIATCNLEIAIKSRICDKKIVLKNPVIASSGTFGFGTEYKTVFDINILGGIASKGLTLEPRQGNSGIRLWETPSGLMNSIGLQNPGIPHFIENELLQMQKLGPAVLANLSGSTIESYVEGAKLLEDTNVDAIELNISCPNVASGGAALGMTCSDAGDITARIRKIISKPLIVKLTPQAPDITGVAIACQENGADAISLCNSFQGVAIDIEKGKPVFDKIKAGFGGPAVRPIALRLVWEVVEAMNRLPEDQRIPVIGIGGIATWQDAVEFIMAGALAVEVGTATFANPYAMREIVTGLEAFMKRKGYSTIEEMRGIAHS